MGNRHVYRHSLLVWDMSMRVTILIAFVTACSSNSPAEQAGDDVDSGSGSGDAMTFSLHGQLSDPLGSEANQRAVVGIAAETDVSGSVDCSKLRVKWDQVVSTLPTAYALEGVPQGNWLLVALLPKTGATQAPFGVLSIVVDATGVHYNSQQATNMIDIAIQGTASYACP